VLGPRPCHRGDRQDIHARRKLLLLASPDDLHHNLQGLKARSRSTKGGSSQEVWIEDRAKDWQPIDNYGKEFAHPKWIQWGEQAKHTGHSGGDFFIIHEFLEAIRSGGPPPIDAYDAAA